MGFDVPELTPAWRAWGRWPAALAAGSFALAALTLPAKLEASESAPRGWILLTRILAGLMVVVAVVGAGFPPLAHALGWEVDAGLVTGVPSLVVLLIMLPWWSLWLRRWPGSVRPPDGESLAG